MNANLDAASPARGARIFHGALCLGLLFATAMLVAMRQRTHPIFFPKAEYLGIALGGVALALLAVARLQLRTRLPARRSDQTLDTYWGEMPVRSSAIALWGVVEGAGFLSAVGYFITGSAVLLVTIVLVLGAQVAYRPARLEADGAA